MRVLVISNQKGGVGKTTTAISLGAALADAGQRVLIVDLDPQANATSGLGLGKSGSGIYSVLLKEQPITEAIVHSEIERLDVLPSGPDMAGAEVELVPVMAREFRLREALQAAAPHYDAVIVDCPPSLGLLTVNALAAGDEVVVPVQCEYYALEGLAQLLGTIDAVHQRLNQRLEVLAIVLTMEDRRNRLSMQVIDEVRSHFPALVAQTRIPRTVRLAEAPSYGKPITRYDPGSRAAKAYTDLAGELLQRMRRREPMALAGSA